MVNYSSFQLAGRVLLIFLFIGFILQGRWSFARLFVSIVGLAACILVAIGFKAKWAGAFLVIILSVFNVFTNNWWSVHSAHPQRDFLKYDFFQTLCRFSLRLQMCFHSFLRYSHCRWSPSPCQYGTWRTLGGWKEESLLINASRLRSCCIHVSVEQNTDCSKIRWLTSQCTHFSKLCS